MSYLSRLYLGINIYCSPFKEETIYNLLMHELLFLFSPSLLLFFGWDSSIYDIKSLFQSILNYFIFSPAIFRWSSVSTESISITVSNEGFILMKKCFCSAVCNCSYYQIACSVSSHILTSVTCQTCVLLKIYFQFLLRCCERSWWRNIFSLHYKNARLWIN